MRWYSMSLVFTALIVIGTKDANATNWKVMGKSNSGTYYADIDSAKTVAEGMYKSIWTRTEFKKTHVAPNGRNYQSLKQIIYIDCVLQKMATKSVYAYKSVVISGKPAFSVTYKNYMLDFSPEPPGSVGETLIKYMCKK